MELFSRTCAGGTHAVELGAGESEGRPTNANGKTIVKTLALLKEPDDDPRQKRKGRFGVEGAH